jgi:hypothetical protein
VGANIEMTTPTDETKALIADTRLNCLYARKGECLHIEKLLDALERDHAIVERLTMLIDALVSRGKDDYCDCGVNITESEHTIDCIWTLIDQCQEALTPPEQRQCSATPQTGECE